MRSSGSYGWINSGWGITFPFLMPYTSRTCAAAGSTRQSGSNRKRHFRKRGIADILIRFRSFKHKYKPARGKVQAPGRKSPACFGKKPCRFSEKAQALSGKSAASFPRKRCSRQFLRKPLQGHSSGREKRISPAAKFRVRVNSRESCTV